MNQLNSVKSLSRLDLNLLVTLHALLETNSTTKAAEKIFRTQSSVSVSLGRLRDFFNDPLFIRYGPKLTPTEFALQLKQPLSRVLFELTNIVEQDMSFDPKTTNRQITLAIPDIAQSLISKIFNALRLEAPNANIVMANAVLEITDYEEGVKQLLNGNIDLMMSFYINEVPQGVHIEKLQSQTWAVFANENHPISDRPSLEEWASYQHIQVVSGKEGRSPITDLLANTKIKRTIGLKVNSFLQALHIVAESDLLLTTMGPLASSSAERLGLKKIILPMDVPTIPFCILTRSNSFEPLSDWLLKVVTETVIPFEFKNDNVSV